MASKDSITTKKVVEKHVETNNIPISKEDIVKDAKNKTMVVASSNNTTAKEDVETEATITNIVASDNTDRMISGDEDNEKEALSNLGVSMDELNLGPQKKLLVLPVTGFLVHRARRSRPNSNPKNRKHDFRLGNYKSE